MRRALLAAPFLALATACVAVHERFVLRPEPIPSALLQWTVAASRAALEGREAPDPPADVAHDFVPPAPVAISLFRRGKLAHRATAQGPITRAVLAAADRLAKAAGAGTAGTIRVDVPTARKPFLGVSWIDAVAWAPLSDGLGTTFADRTDYVAPWDLLAMGAYERHWVGPDLRPGQWHGLGKTRAALRARAGGVGEMFRLRVASVVEGAHGGDDRITRENLRRAGRDGAAFLVGQLRADGRYRYSYDPLTDGDAEKDYNVPRHNGTTYFLAQAARYLEDPAFARAAQRGIDHLRRVFVRRDRFTGTFAAGDSRRVNTGSAALGAVAIAEYRHVTGDRRYDSALRGLSDWLVEMQRPGGDFAHRYDLDTGEREEGWMLYFTGEAALALLKAHEELGDRRYLDAARKALDWLTSTGWSFFGAEYLPGEEHWTCIAANESYPRIKRRRYLDFCRHWASHRRARQLGPTVFGGDGGYGIAPMVVPNTTPTGSTTEATVSTALLARKWGEPDREIEDQTKRAARLLLRRQLRGDILHLFPDPDEASGGFPSSGVTLDVRIDFVQHAASALLRMTELL